MTDRERLSFLMDEHQDALNKWTVHMRTNPIFVESPLGLEMIFNHKNYEQQKKLEDKANEAYKELKKYTDTYGI